MLNRYINFKTIIAVIAVIIVSGTIFYSNYLSKKIATEERLKIYNWQLAVRINNDTSLTEINTLALKLVADSMDIPALMITEKKELLALRNIDTTQIKDKPLFIDTKINEFKKINDSIVWINTEDSTQKNIIYYGESKLLKEVKYYPIIQLLIVVLFITVVFLTIQSQYKSTQNQVWAGLAKETAHQLGTPVSSLAGWIEVLKTIDGNERVIYELEKDIERLQLITNRFGKIGSKPVLEEKDIVAQVSQMIDYIKKRSGNNITFNFLHSQAIINTKISAPLFDWVIENLLKNALDAMEGKGKIEVNVQEEKNKIIIDVADTGKGITANNLKKIFKPGFTTKKRGWGLGLTLTKRIIEQYHNGVIYVKNSEVNKGTTFRIELKK